MSEITQDMTIRQIMADYPWLPDKVAEYGEPYASAVKSPLALYSIMKKTVHEVCRLFNLDEPRVLKILNRLVREHEEAEKKQYILLPYLNEKGQMTTPATARFLNDVLGEDASQDEKVVLRVAVLTCQTVLSRVTSDILKGCVLNVKEQAKGTPWHELVDNISQHAIQNAADKL